MRLRATYSVFQTDLEGNSKLFAVGDYDDEITFVDGPALLPEEARRDRQLLRAQFAGDSALTIWRRSCRSSVSRSRSAPPSSR
ncbi:MAG: hypothetical protein WDO24_13260 [Pseudomonadota bacterium]